MNWQVWSMAYEGWLRHRCARLGAALAYYSVFSVGPLLLILTSIAGLFLGQETARRTLMANLREQMGETGSQAVETLLSGASSEKSGMFAAITGVILLFVGALGVVVQLKDALNTIWEVDRAKHATWWSVIRSYLMSLAGILALGILLAASIVVSTALNAVVDWAVAGTSQLLWQAIAFVLSSAVLTILFALLFRLFPDAPVEWRAVWPAAAVTAVLFQVGTLAISWYVGTQALTSTYGAAASVVVLLIWVYYSAQIVLFGAELARASSATSARTDSAKTA
jgi:membrane protein